MKKGGEVTANNQEDDYDDEVNTGVEGVGPDAYVNDFLYPSFP